MEGEDGGWGRAGPPVTESLIVNLPNSSLPKQWNEKYRHQQNSSLNVTREETSNSINYNFSNSKVT